MDYRRKCELLSAEHHRQIDAKNRAAGLPEWQNHFRTIGELFAAPSPTHGDTWGNWRYNAKTLALTYVPRNYDFDLEDSETFGAIFHVTAKTWMSVEDAGHLVFALADLKYPYGWADANVDRQAVQQLRAMRSQRVSSAFGKAGLHLRSLNKRRSA